MSTKERSNYEQKRDWDLDCFFITMIKSITSEKPSYLEMPNNNCFKYCVSEIIYTLEKAISKKVNIRDNFTQMSTVFYNYMLDDIVLKEIDLLVFKSLVLNLKKYSEGNAKDSDYHKLSYFRNLDNFYSKRYKQKLYKMLLNEYSSEKPDIDKFYKLSKIFINELLAYGMDYQFINYAVKLFENKEISGVIDFIKYLHYSNKDDFELYIPIKKDSSQDLQFLKKNKQEIIKINNTNYFKTYVNNYIDYFMWTKKQMIRIESILNILRFYTDSEIEFDLSKNILIESTLFDKKLEIPFKDIITYNPNLLNRKNTEKLLLTFDLLKGDEGLFIKNKDLDVSYKIINNRKNQNNRELFHKILNILSFIEKDKDVLNSNSFVDNWIALETLCSMSTFDKGYESVKKIAPKIISTKMILKDINDIFYRAFNNKPTFKAENFIKLLLLNRFDFNRIINPYYRYRLLLYEKNIKTLTKLNELIINVENEIITDLMRIYIVRNEYTHESNLNAFNSMQQYKLKLMLPLILDEFFRELNTIVSHERNNDYLAQKVFDNMLEKSDIRNNTFELILNPPKSAKNGSFDFKIDIEKIKIPEYEIIFNILKNNKYLLKIYESV